VPAINQIEQIFDSLDREHQLLVIERLARRMRLGQRDPEEVARQLTELANEPGLNAPYPLPDDWGTKEQRTPRGER
jgi:hypothetical protein